MILASNLITLVRVNDGAKGDTGATGATGPKGDGLDIKDTRNDNQQPSWYITNYPKTTVAEFKFCNVLGLSNVGTYCILTTTVPWGDKSGGYPKQTAKVESTGKEFWRVGTSETAWSAWADPYGSALEAAKTATNYMAFNDVATGLVIGDMTASTLGKNVLIDSDSVDIRNGSTTLASFGEDRVILGRNNEKSYIDLCDGAGKISANTAEAATSYPNRNAILIDSQEIETESVRFVATVSNEYGATTAPNPKKYAEVYLLRESGTSGTTARIKSEHWNTSTGKYINAGFVGLTYDDTAKTYASMYVSDSFNSVYNSVKVYKSKTTMNKPLFINGTEFTGSNKVLWSGTFYMTAGHTATLSEAVSDQANGIVLLFSRYSDGTAQNYHFQPHYVPKSQVINHPGVGHSFLLTSDGSFSIMACKYLYVNDTSIAGNAVNNTTGTGTSGIKYTNNAYVLRYVIGV